MKPLSKKQHAISIEPLLVVDDILMIKKRFALFQRQFFARKIEHEIKDEIDSFFEKVNEDLLEEFMCFEKKFDREWTNIEEKIIRFENFQKNYAEIKKLNVIGKLTNTEYGINDFADWTPEEFKSILLPLDYYKNLRRNATFIKPINPILENSIIDKYPNHFDWRDQGVVTEIKAQKKCGSCWAFASVATVESAYAIAYGELRNLSVQELLDCNFENNAYNNGGDADKAFHFVHKNGLMNEDAYPYVAHRQNSCALAGETTKIDGAYFINPHEASIIDWLVNFGPVNIGISVTQDIRSYKAGVFRPSDYDCKYKVIGLHSLLVVGYGTDVKSGQKYWILKNSWGNTWGHENGYINFIRGVNACGIENEPIGLLA